MKRIILAVVGALSVATGVQAQTYMELSNAQLIERALAAAPARARDGAAVVKWNADFTYTTIKEGDGTLACYDHSGGPGERPFAVQCTSPGNLDRVAQSYRFEAEAMGDRQAVQARVAAAEADGSRVKPVYGSAWISMSGNDQASARIHTTIAVPGATTESTGLPDNPRQGGAWIMNAGTSTAHIMIPGV